MLVHGSPERTIRREGRAVRLLDQRWLPHEVRWEIVRSVDAMVEAIRDMHVRGAPLIGAAAAYGMALAREEGIDLKDAASRLLGSRPTAVDLRHAVEAALAASDLDAFADAYADASVAMCTKIGEHGADALLARRDAERPLCVLTHCNAGWLATVDRGTALAPLYELHERGIPLHVYVDETRPRNQGAALTAWELDQEGIPHTLLADNAGGLLMRQGKVDAVIVGADRVSANGDVANKVGTYLKALAARDNDVPFVVAFPTTTFDARLADGDKIPIEERHEDEVHWVQGRTPGGTIERVRISPATTRAANPAFDVTPARLIDLYVTEEGAAPRDRLASILAPARAPTG